MVDKHYSEKNARERCDGAFDNDVNQLVILLYFLISNI